jgi:ribosomal protein S3
MRGAHVVLEEADDTGESGVMVTRVVVNGVDVGTLAEAPKITVGTKGDDVTKITMTLIPSRLEIRGELADGERREPRAGFAAKID